MRERRRSGGDLVVRKSPADLFPSREPSLVFGLVSGRPSPLARSFSAPVTTVEYLETAHTLASGNRLSVAITEEKRPTL